MFQCEVLAFLRKSPQRQEMQREWGREGMWAPWAPWEWVYKEKSPVSPKNPWCCKASAHQVDRVFCSASCAVFKNHTFLKRDKRGEQTNFDTDQVFSLEHFLMIKLYKLLKNPVPVVMETLTFHLGLTSPYSCYCFSSICSFDYTIRAVNTNSAVLISHIWRCAFFWHP